MRKEGVYTYTKFIVQVLPRNLSLKDISLKIISSQIHAKQSRILKLIESKAHFRKQLCFFPPHWQEVHWQ